MAAVVNATARFSAPAMRVQAAGKARVAPVARTAGVASVKSSFTAGRHTSLAMPVVASRMPRTVTRAEVSVGNVGDRISDEFEQDEMHGEHTRLFLSDVIANPRKKLFFNRKYTATDLGYIGFMTVMHGLIFLAPQTFSWANVGLFFATYVVTGMLGITLSFHRQLTHKSFETPKWLEYVFAYCGVLAVQGDPIEWVSSHRHHHAQCDTPRDPHSPYEGFFWSHMGWLLDEASTLTRVADRSNANDMAKDKFYQHIQKHYIWHTVAQFAALYAFGGLPAIVWGGAMRICWVYHVTWFVNSAAHVWGGQSWNTGDLSRNNWWVGIIAFGEGWHNNHHAFEYSARHGLEWWQWDPTWYTIKVLEFLGLAKKIRYPREEHMKRLAFK